MTVASDDHYDKTKSPDGDLVASNDHDDKTKSQAHDPNSFTKRSMIKQTDMNLGRNLEELQQKKAAPSMPYKARETSSFLECDWAQI